MALCAGVKQDGAADFHPDGCLSGLQGALFARNAGGWVQHRLFNADRFPHALRDWDCGRRYASGALFAASAVERRAGDYPDLSRHYLLDAAAVGYGRVPLAGESISSEREQF